MTGAVIELIAFKVFGGRSNGSADTRCDGALGECLGKEGRRQLEGGEMGEVPKVSRRSGE